MNRRATKISYPLAGCRKGGDGMEAAGRNDIFFARVMQDEVRSAVRQHGFGGLDQVAAVVLNQTAAFPWPESIAAVRNRY